LPEQIRSKLSIFPLRNIPIKRIQKSIGKNLELFRGIFLDDKTADAADKLRDRIVKLYAHLGAADDGHETGSALRKLLACLHDNDKTWTHLTLTTQMGLEQLNLLTPDELAKECPYCKRIFASFASLLAAPDGMKALIDAHEQIGAADPAVSAQARQQVKAILYRLHNDLNRYFFKLSGGNCLLFPSPEL
jgi:hypothetical protein